MGQLTEYGSFNYIKLYIIMILSETKLYMYVCKTHTYIYNCLLMQDTYYC